MTVFFAEEGFQPYKLDMALVGHLSYWENIVEQAVETFAAKEPFMNWVCSHYFDDSHRFVASACWDIAVLQTVEDADEGLD